MKIRAILAATVLMSACSQKPTAAPQAGWSLAEALTPCDSEIDGAVLKKLSNLWVLTAQNTIDDMDRYDHNLKCVREWADTLKDPCVRNSYYKWLESYERGSNKRRAQIMRPEESAPGEESEYEIEARKIREYERHHPIPAPPPDACERSLIEKVKP